MEDLPICTSNDQIKSLICLNYRTDTTADFDSEMTIVSLVSLESAAFVNEI